MKKIINLLEAHGVQVFRAEENFFVHEGEEEVNINFWDQDEAFNFLGYDPEQKQLFNH